MSIENVFSNIYQSHYSINPITIETKPKTNKFEKQFNDIINKTYSRNKSIQTKKNTIIGNLDDCFKIIINNQYESINCDYDILNKLLYQIIDL